ncbi:hypothetical protein AN214_03909 [Pseudoalteromonas sp. P1-9]|uniref:hypothetical protein n=1 Tax=Pseudoalteromonas sp. P1-9 TaxID=1710354 RepID=UPI0006D5E5BD|nr:hypothetical protein [Pseudoalteromonas sp. P1-9]KPV94076.1 hypothetical protein AN214_03909 [Pseudoalteromonas sp. P1-9]
MKPENFVLLTANQTSANKPKFNDFIGGIELLDTVFQQRINLELPTEEHHNDLEEALSFLRHHGNQLSSMASKYQKLALSNETPAMLQKSMLSSQ